MQWSLTSADTETPQRAMDLGMDEHLKRNLVMTKLEDLLAWSRSRSIWPFNFGLSCCYVEMATALTSRFDLARFGSEVIRATPRPDAFIQGLTLLQDAVGNERRPLSWLVEDQGVRKAPKVSQRDKRNDQRMIATDLREPNQV